jgi:Uma2 family endonuclease
MSISMNPLPGTVRDPLYPDSDGETMGETDYHMDALIDLREGLRDFFRKQRDVYVASDMFWYYEQGNPRACRAPDVMVAKGVVGKHNRRSFRSWEEKTKPCVIFEIVSERTVEEDLGEKKTLYAQLGVAEYFVFDPEGPYLDPPFQGFRLVRGKYKKLAADSDGSLVSQQLGIRLVPEGTLLRLIDITTGKPKLTRAERADRAEQKAQRASQKAKRDRDRAKALEAEIKRLRSMLGQANGERQ